MRPSKLLAAAAVAAGFVAAGPVPVAAASNLIDRNATNVRLVVTKDNAAHLLYTAGGKAKHVVAWGAINAAFPNPAKKQVEFTVNYNAGWGSSYYTKDASTLANTCGGYDGPKLPWLVVACKAKDGSYWAVQSWQRMLPDFGLQPTPARSVWELRLSHWSGPLPVLTVKQDWAWRKYDAFYGSYTYLGKPMYGFKTDSRGAPLDNWGVLIYLDSFNSAYGRGWRREMGWTAHRGSGNWCYSMNEHQVGGQTRPSGKGSAYRMTAQSPGALPDIGWVGKSPGAYNAAADTKANADRRANFPSKACNFD